MFRKRDLRRLWRGLLLRWKATRGLRFRLMASYALFFAVLLIGVAALFQASLVSALDTHVHEVLNEEWAAMKVSRTIP